MALTGYKYLCSAGETFDSIALALFKDEKYACDLMNANPELVDKLVFTGMEKLKIPYIVIENAGDEGVNYTGETAPWRR